MIRWLSMWLFLMPLVAVAAEPLPMGRLFLTPAERAAFDVVRQNNRPPEKIVVPGTDDYQGAELPSAPIPVVTVDGYVKRTDGKGTVWVNGQPVEEKAVIKNLEIGRLQRNTNDVSITLPGNGQKINLKAGQSYDPASGKIGSLRELAPVAEPPASPPAQSAATAPSDTASAKPSSATPQKPPSLPVPAPPK